MTPRMAVMIQVPSLFRLRTRSSHQGPARSPLLPRIPAARLRTPRRQSTSTGVSQRARRSTGGPAATIHSRVLQRVAVPAKPASGRARGPPRGGDSPRRPPGPGSGRRAPRASAPRRVDPTAGPQAEVEPRVAGRQVAAAADAPGDLAAAAGGDRDRRPDGVAVRPRPLEAEGHEVARPRRLVVEGDQRLVLRDDQDVDAAVVVEVADGQPAADAGHLPRGPGPRRRRRSAGRSAPPSRSCAGIA